MKLHGKQIIPVLGLVLCSSCSVIEKSSMHGFDSGYYKLTSDKNQAEEVYLDVSDEMINVYNRTDHEVNRDIRLSVSLSSCDSVPEMPLKLSKRSWDIDITSILLKYRPAVHGLPAQLTTDFNVALYAGWRKDFYRLSAKTDPIGNRRCAMVARGYDFGLFAGPGTTYIDASTLLDPIEKAYSGFIIQYGMAGFLETGFASFGIATGFDYLLSPDRSSWIFNNKPWVGFIIGIALN